MSGFSPIRRLLPPLLLALAIACGSGGGSADDVSGGEGGASLFEDRLIANTDTTHTVDDLVSVGYKKSRQIDTETLPNAQDAWYGFFNQRDIEVWVFESHQDALDVGVDPAEAAISRRSRTPSDKLPLPTEKFVNAYAAFAVFGNLVMLCEIELATCEALIAEID